VYANGASFYFGFVPAWPPNPCVAGDLLSGPASCAVTDSHLGGFGAVGTHNLTATAHDVAGNEYKEYRTYTVMAWTLRGFYQPVDMSPVNGPLVFNRVRNGSTVPLKFEIFAGTEELINTSAVKSLTVDLVACVSGAFIDDIETVATGGTVLRYDSTSGQFIFNWKTPSTANKCYRVTMTTQDDSTLVAYFTLR
jgi:hypothetical protein